jgi:hypothetical protein
MVKMVNSRNRLPIYDDTAVYDLWRILCNGYIKKAFIYNFHSLHLFPVCVMNYKSKYKQAVFAHYLSDVIPLFLFYI